MVVVIFKKDKLKKKKYEYNGMISKVACVA